MNRIRLVLLLIAAVLPAASAIGKEESAPIGVQKVESIASVAKFGQFDYSPILLLDGNLTTCWSVNLDQAKKDGHYKGKELQGLVFTLEEGDLGVMVMWNGFCTNTSLWRENAAAASVVVMDYNTKAILANAKVPDKFEPFVLTINRKLRKCDDGLYRVQVNFGGLGTDGVRPGSEYKDFCVSELWFWSGNEYTTTYPTGDRPAFGVAGPVKKIVQEDRDDVEFTVDGFTYVQKGGKPSYSTTGTTVTYSGRSERWETNTSIVLKYDFYGNLVSLKETSSDGKVNVESSFVYDWDGNVLREEFRADGTSGWYYHAYRKGLPYFWEFHDNSDNNEVSHYYKVLETDKYGNWLVRKVFLAEPPREPSGLESRQLQYY